MPSPRVLRRPETLALRVDACTRVHGPPPEAQPHLSWGVPVALVAADSGLVRRSFDLSWGGKCSRGQPSRHTWFTFLITSSGGTQSVAYLQHSCLSTEQQLPPPSPLREFDGVTSPRFQPSMRIWNPTLQLLPQLLCQPTTTSHPTAHFMASTPRWSSVSCRLVGSEQRDEEPPSSLPETWLKLHAVLTLREAQSSLHQPTCCQSTMTGS